MNFIKKYCLNRRLSIFNRKRKEEQTNIYALKEAKSICFFITLNVVEKLEELMKCISRFDNKKTIICYLPKTELPQNMAMLPFLHTISNKDVNLIGGMNEQVKNIFSQHYNIFIDIDTEQDLMSLYLKTFLSADFRIGRNKEYYNYFDFTLCADENYNIKDYISNLEKYTDKLKGN